jgi:HEPN domain-containing protein
MSAAANLQVQTLFIKSAEDEHTLTFAVRDAVFEFHAQQAIEKLLKALIAAHGEVFPFTHDLQLLIDQLERLGEVLVSRNLASWSATTWVCHSMRQNVRCTEKSWRTCVFSPRPASPCCLELPAKFL